MRIVLFLFISLVMVACKSPDVADDAPAKTEQVKAVKPAGNSTDCLAEAVYFEARGTGAQGARAVAHVVLNRAASSEFPNSVCAVVADKCQFSYRCDGKSDALTNKTDRNQAYKTARLVLGGAPDITDGALFFHSERMDPGWFATRPRVGRFGGNIFYR